MDIPLRIPLRRKPNYSIPVADPAPVDKEDDFGEALRKVLKRNYEVLGFTLVQFGVFAPEDGDGTKADMRGTIRCPCGGLEYFYQRIWLDEILRARGNIVEHFAHDMLRGSASRQHLLADIADGTLPADFDIEGHYYTGKLL